jgi:hypothetical protein
VVVSSDLTVFFTLLLISVENARPTSWQSIDGEGIGVKRTKMKRTGIFNQETKHFKTLNSFL